MVVDSSQGRIHAKDHWKFYPTGRKMEPTRVYMPFADKPASRCHPAPLLSPSLLSSSHYWGTQAPCPLSTVAVPVAAGLHRCGRMPCSFAQAHPSADYIRHQTLRQGSTVNTHMCTHIHKPEDLRMICPTVVWNTPKQVLTKCFISGFVFHLMCESHLESDNLVFLSILHFFLQTHMSESLRLQVYLSLFAGPQQPRVFF